MDNFAVGPVKPIDSGGRVRSLGDIPPERAKVDFKDILQGRLAKSAGAPRFSKHALERMEQRGIHMSQEQLFRIGSAIEQAKEKGSKDSVVVVDDLAMVVNVNNSTVVTCLDAKGAILTKIDSVVFI